MHRPQSQSKSEYLWEFGEIPSGVFTRGLTEGIIEVHLLQSIKDEACPKEWGKQILEGPVE